jgi:D-sedoheptulose 7-phosphate isomerase
MEINGQYLLDQIESRISDARSLYGNSEAFNPRQISNLGLDIVKVFGSGKKVAFFGNGGSAAEAMHIAAEFTGKCVVEHEPLDVICLNESQSAITAIANDFGADKIFSRQVEAHLHEGDVLIALSTSGKSENVLKALEVATRKKIRSIIWMGNFPFQIPGVETWKVPSTSTPRIQEIHLTWGHILAESIEIIIERGK